MKNNQLALMLVFVLLLSALLSGWLAWSYNSSLRQLQRYQPFVPSIQHAQNILQAFANDINEYTKKNPAAVPVLQSLQAATMKTPQGALATKPAGK
jgi:predicted negative regulator of RcsB-dependent stress response